MDNKIIALSDDELMEVTGGLVQLINPSGCDCSKAKNKTSCKKIDEKCNWSTAKSLCEGGGGCL